MNERTIAIELGERKEGSNPRRFPVSVSSETPVPRHSPYTGERYDEVLSHVPSAVDLSRAPLPVLEGHDRSKVNVGIVTDLRVGDGKLRGVLELGASARAQELAADIAAGIVRNLSVGYSINAEERDDKRKRITATRWTPHEVSIVSVPADVTVGIGRSTHMDEQTQQQTPPADDATRTDPAVLAERERVSTITDLCRRSNLDALGRELISRGVSLDAARVRILDALATRDEQIVTENHVRIEDGGYEAITGRRGVVTPGSDTTQDFQRAAVDALLLRSGIHVEKPHAAARDVSASVYDLARVCLSRSGKSASGWFGGEVRGPKLIERAMGTADFPNILAGSLHAAIRNGYEQEPSSHRAWVRTAPVSDFRTQSRPILGSAPSLEAVGEYGEYKEGSMDDDAASYTVAKYGKIVALTWEALVNDNLGAFLRVQPALGQAARRAEADTVYALFPLNTGAGPTMQDSVALFHSSHANLTSTTDLDAASLGAARALLRKQTALGGGYLALAPKYLIVPAGLETDAEILLANAARPAAGTDKTTGAWIASLELVVEPRLADTACYLAADSTQIDTIELGLLEENMGGPVVEEEEEFVRDVKRWKVRHVFGAKALDFRGMVKMPISG